MLQLNKISHIYNPTNQSYEELLKNFVIRKKEFNRIVRELKNSDFDSSSQHYLIEGQRGTGKTSLLLRIRYEIEYNEELSNLIAVQFAEEQYNIFDLCRLWESAADFLEEIDGFESLSEELESQSENDSYAIDCFKIFERYLIKNNKKLILLLDNFGDVLDKLSEIEQMRLRDIFHTSKHIQLIAASSKSLEHTYKHDKPFFEFFKIIKLDGLNKEESNILLKQLSKTVNSNIEDIIKNQPNRIETIRRLTGGIPRTMVLLFEIFLDDSANVFEDLEMILDRVTPLYKHRMDDLPTQQQAIVDTIALNWDGMTSKEIVVGLSKRGFDTKKVSSQLNILVKNDLVISKKIDKKNKLYMVKERFFNIWYLMRYGRKKNKTQVLWLVKFLEEWCDGDELINRAKNHIKCAKENTLHPKGGYYMGEALALVVNNNELQHELLIETKKALVKFDPSIDKNMSKSDIELIEKVNTYFYKNEFILSMKMLNKIKHKTAIIYHTIGYVFDEGLNNNEEAIKFYNIAYDKGFIASMHNLGILYIKKLNDYKQSINCFKISIKKGYIDSIQSLADLYSNELKDYENAIKYYKLAIEKENSLAMNNLAVLYDEKLKDYENAIKYYKMGIEKEDQKAMNNLALLYSDEFKDYENAIKYYKMAIEKENSLAMNNLAVLYSDELKDYENAIKYYKMAVAKDNVNAMNSLSCLYYEIAKEKKESLKTIQKAVEIEKNKYNIHTLATVQLWNDLYLESINSIEEFVNDFYTKEMTDDMIDYFILLLAKKQHHLAYNLFEKYPNLKDEFKPIYYTLMLLLKDEYPKEYLKMGSELEETVEEILVKVEKYSNKYK